MRDSGVQSGAQAAKLRRRGEHNGGACVALVRRAVHKCFPGSWFGLGLLAQAPRLCAAATAAAATTAACCLLPIIPIANCQLRWPLASYGGGAVTA